MFCSNKNLDFFAALNLGIVSNQISAYPNYQLIFYIQYVSNEELTTRSIIRFAKH